MINFIYQATDEEIMPFGGLPIVSRLIEETQLSKRLDALPYRESGKALIPNSDIIKTMIGIMAQGKADYATVAEFDDSDYFAYAMNISKIPSQERLRQRLDMMSPIVKDIIDSECINLLKKLNVTLTPTFKKYIPFDIDVSPFDNSNTKKEGCNCTYKLHDGFAPMFGYLGSEGYLIGTEFREGKQHSQAGTKDFLKVCIDRIRQVTDQPVLLRADSGNDAAENVDLLLEEKIDFVIKKNFRRSVDSVIKKVLDATNEFQVRDEYGTKKKIYRYKEANETNTIYHYYLVKEITETKEGQLLLIPEYELEGFVSSLDESVEDIKEIYRMHGTCEQFHSELKTDMDLERLPSGKFKTNDLLLHIAMFTYNILRYIGQGSMQSPRNPKRKRDVKKMVVRRRLKSVIKDMILLASKLVRHAKQVYVKASKKNKWFECVGDVYRQMRLQLR
jgi:hypothetical protein